MVKFRFQNLEIWQDSISIADELLDIGNILEQRKLFRFADQIRGAAMSVSNNIAEGSGASSKKVFKRYLDIARSSVFENANIVILLSRRKLISQTQTELIMDELETLSRRITAFKKNTDLNPTLRAPSTLSKTMNQKTNQI